MRTLLLLIILTTCHCTLAQRLKVYQADSSLSNEFVTALCDASRHRTMVAGGNITYLEQLINEAAGTHRGDSLQSQKTLSWHKRHIHALYCAAEGRHEAGDLIRQAIKSDFREFANIIGPNRHLTLDLFAPDPHDSLNSFEYIDTRRQLYEARHNNDRA